MITHNTAYVLGFLDGIHGVPGMNNAQAEERHPCLTTYERTKAYQDGWLDGWAKDCKPINAIMQAEYDPDAIFDQARAEILRREALTHA